MAISITMPTDPLTFARRDFASVEEDLRMRPGGVYAFYDKMGACLYVGQSKNLLSRFRSHFATSSFAPEIDQIIVYFVEDRILNFQGEK